MAKLNIAPTKSNLLSLKEQLAVSTEGYDLLEQKREILVMELMHLVERVKLLERDMDKCIAKAYPALKRMLLAMGGERTERLAMAVDYKFEITKKPVIIGGMNFTSLDVTLPKRELFSSFMGTTPDNDEVMADFFELLALITQMASIRTIVWRLAMEVKKTQRRVNALDKMVIPQSKETVKYIESVLEERERDNVFVLKALKGRQGR
ncbi:MAG: V-type ATP synthase subunit D [Treponema sp.]|jgi:H(+)-transporting ATP synthase, vacuolar type, subunit D|nr:V-type ATP synthase subunit D [Treponema sp.]MBQ1670955.1 V-type ATP synthase subunit D [Treponema sp.]MBQ2357103.1 V-type ATP synthase subunit D [Treponema sp.]MBQ2464583.1 V-type ATP synthase subunit D [Treponema sp.]MBQ2482035.1 V-type ATP synthase subunit D [Treponema sp.]